MSSPVPPSKRKRTREEEEELELQKEAYGTRGAALRKGLATLQSKRPEPKDTASLKTKVGRFLRKVQGR